MSAPTPPAHRALLHGIAIGLSLLGTFFTSGCVTSTLANRIIRAPNLQSTPSKLGLLTQLRPALDTDHYTLATKIAVTPHPALISVGVIDPGDYKLVHEFKPIPDNPQYGELHMSFGKRDATAATSPPKGTIFLLHGVMMYKESMLHWAFFLAQKGYRVVLVDLRGHGQSTGKVISYGAWETADLSQVLDALERRQIVAGRVGVLGISYGGAIAIDWAARDARISSVVALAPFSDTRKAIVDFARALMPKVLSLVSEERISAAFDLAAKRGGFTWKETDVVDAARKLPEPLLLFHGKNDIWVFPRNSTEIKAVSPAGSQLFEGLGDHVSISVRLAPIDKQVLDWFDRALIPPPVTTATSRWEF